MRILAIGTGGEYRWKDHWGPNEEFDVHAIKR
jgi:hypothetical protein